MAEPFWKTKKILDETFDYSTMNYEMVLRRDSKQENYHLLMDLLNELFLKDNK